MQIIQMLKWIYLMTENQSIALLSRISEFQNMIDNFTGLMADAVRHLAASSRWQAGRKRCNKLLSFQRE